VCAARQIGISSALLIALGSCFSTHLEQFSCDIPCTAGCSAPLECRHGFCVLPDAPDCQPSSPPECVAIGELEIELEPRPVSVYCTGEPIALTVTLSGGSTPYVWMPSGLEGLVLDGNLTSSSTLEVSGQLTAPGRRDVTIEVQAGEGQTCQRANTRFSFDVVEGPTIAISGLEQACVGEPVVGTLSATDGERTSDVWSVQSDALPSGLRLEGNTIVGTPSEAGTFAFDVTLVSAPCQPVRRRVSLPVRAAGECPAITLAALAAPCDGIEYSAALIASSGQPPYEWAILEGPSWLSVDPSMQTLRGMPDGEPSARVTLQLTDSRQHVTSRSFVFEPRQSCYLAYVSEAAEGPGLHYSDVFLARDVLVSRELPAGSAVTDFEFSPDGAFIAFRAGSIGDQALYLYSTATTTPSASDSVLRLPFECSPIEIDGGVAACSVLDYAWSADSQHLAVALGAPDATDNFLSGVDVNAPESPWAAVATTYRDELIWVGNSVVAYSGIGSLEFGAEAESPFFVYYSVASHDLAAPDFLFEFASDWRLRSTPAGFFFFDGDSRLLYLSLPPEGRPPAVYSHTPGWISPSGDYVAVTTQDARLQLYAADNPITPRAESEPGSCEVVFTWATERETIACSRSASSPPVEDSNEPTVATEQRFFSHGSGLRIFDFRDDAAPPERLTQWSIPVERYREVATSGQRRSLSPNGDWLIFLGGEAGQEVIQGVSTRETSAATRRYAPALQAPVELAFSPQGDSFVTYEREVLEFATPDRPPSQRVFATAQNDRFEATPRIDCAEQFYVNPERWCGNPRISNHFDFSADGTSVLFEDAGRTLWLSDRSDTSAVARTAGAALPECNAACPKQPYAFRP
jgi:hypothetical protein